MNRPARRPVRGPHLRRGEAWGEGLRRVTLDCLKDAGVVMAAPGLTEVERVHQVRVTLKRARAVLRLFEAGGCRWARPNRLRLSRLARELSRLRDAAVLNDLRRKLRLGAGRVGTRSRGIAGVWFAALAAEEASLAARRWPEFTPAQRRRVLAAMVRELARREAAARARPKARRVHAWRKRVIVLREQLNVLWLQLPARQRLLVARLQAVARKLGGAQDLSLLLATEKAIGTGAAHAARLASLKARRRRKVKAARRLATGLTVTLAGAFAAKPR